MKTIFSVAVAAAAVILSTSAIAREYISIVGSSTVYPFSIKVAGEFGNTTQFNTPVVESTGSGGGMKLFCSGYGMNSPSITNASRRIKFSEFESCHKNGVEVVEILVGFDGIAIANSKVSPQLSLTRRDIFLALAKEVPNPDGSESLLANPYKTWKEVNPSLPDIAIEVMGPPPTSGTRDAFAELAMEGGCKTFDWIKVMRKKDKNAYKSVCHNIREDGAYVESGENDNLIVQKLEKNPLALGIFGFSFLEENSSRVQASIVEGVAPTFESIAAKDYTISRPLYFYIKKNHVRVVPGIEAYIAEFIDESTWGPEGYLTDIGLIPLNDTLRASYAADAKNLRTLQASDF